MLIKMSDKGISEFIVYTTTAMAYNCQVICAFWYTTFEDYQKHNEERAQKKWEPLYLVWSQEDGEELLKKIFFDESTMREASQKAVENKRIK